MNSFETVIVGAGLAGLNCAKILTGQGRQVCVLEAADEIGGRVRTERFEGFRLDRGFQVLQTAYPEAQHALDYAALDLRPFIPGAMIHTGRRFQTITDPWRQPRASFGMLFSPVGTLLDKLRMARLRSQLMHASIDALYERPETTAFLRLREYGFSTGMIKRFFQPFLAGVFFDPGLTISSRAFEFIFRAFSEGYAALPAAGMAAIPAQLAASLPPGCIRTGTRVTAVDASGVTLASGERIAAKAVVVATDGVAAARLLGDPAVPGTRGTTCLYFAAERSPIARPYLVLNGTGVGPINCLVVPTLLAPDYAPPGQSLICVNVLGLPAVGDAELEQDVRAQLQDWFGPEAAGWRHLKTLRIADALPLQTPPLANPLRHQPRRADGLYVCGEYGNATSINWALRSGRRAAEAVLATASSA